MVLYYYGRFKMTYYLIPLLRNGYNQDQIASVNTMLGSGSEGFKYPEDIGLDEPENFGFVSSSIHSITLNSLAILKLTETQPNDRFNYVYSGFVNSGAKPYLPWYTRYLLEFVLHFFGKTLDEVPERLINIALLEKGSCNGQLINIEEHPVSAKKMKTKLCRKKHKNMHGILLWIGFLLLPIQETAYNYTANRRFIV